jgi:hypothetical protein
VRVRACVCARVCEFEGVCARVCISPLLLSLSLVFHSPCFYIDISFKYFLSLYITLSLCISHSLSVYHSLTVYHSLSFYITLSLSLYITLSLSLSLRAETTNNTAKVRR